MIDIVEGSNSSLCLLNAMNSPQSLLSHGTSVRVEIVEFGKIRSQLALSTNTITCLQPATWLSSIFLDGP